MAQSEDIQKIKEFVDHLISIPHISGESLLKAEGLILNFIVQNQEQLKATFKTPQFFPHLEWNEVLQLLLSELYDRVSGEIIPLIENIIENSDFQFFAKEAEGQALPSDFQREKLREYFREIFKNKDVRFNFNSAINIFKHDVIDRYMAEIFRRRDYIYNELVRVQKTYLEADEYIVYLKIMLMLKNAGYMKIPFPPGNEGSRINLIDSTRMPGKTAKFIDALAQSVKANIPSIPEKSIKLALKSNLKENFTDVEDASSRFLYILTTRYNEYNPDQVIDRGAESADKSWFAIARKNAEHYGFDKRMLDELYRIAGDNSW